MPRLTLRRRRSTEKVPRSRKKGLRKEEPSCELDSMPKLTAGPRVERSSQCEGMSTKVRRISGEGGPRGGGLAAGAKTGGGGTPFPQDLPLLGPLGSSLGKPLGDPLGKPLGGPSWRDLSLPLKVPVSASFPLV